MDVGRQKAVFLALLLCQLVLVGSACGQQMTEGADAQQVLEQAPADTKFRAVLKISPPLSVAQLHALARRLRLAEFGFSVTAPDIPQMGTGGGTSGEGPGQSDEAWARTLCRLRISTLRSAGVDVPDSALRVLSISPLASAAAIRQLQHELAGAAAVSMLVQQPAGNYESALRQSAGSQQMLAGAFPQDFAAPRGCEGRVHKVAGWRTSDIGRSAARSQKEILQEVAAANPDQPVALELHIAALVSVRDVAALAGTYTVARLSGSLEPALMQMRTRGGGPSLDFEFGSAGPALAQQLAHTDCLLRARYHPRDPALALIDWRQDHASGVAFLKMKAKEALRLVSQPPSWAGPIGHEFQVPGSLEMADQTIVRHYAVACPEPGSPGRSP